MIGPSKICADAGFRSLDGAVSRDFTKKPRISFGILDKMSDMATGQKGKPLGATALGNFSFSLHKQKNV